MRYIMLIYVNEAEAAKMSQEEQGAVFAAYGAFTNEIREKGLMHGGDALQPSSTARTVKVRDGNLVSTDGPFAETKEQLAGYYILDCKDWDEAVAWAAKIPGAHTGRVEVRPIMEMG
jgi:hypothetical protein